MLTYGSNNNLFISLYYSKPVQYASILGSAKLKGAYQSSNQHQKPCSFPVQVDEVRGDYGGKAAFNRWVFRRFRKGQTTGVLCLTWGNGSGWPWFTMKDVISKVMNQMLFKSWIRCDFIVGLHDQARRQQRRWQLLLWKKISHREDTSNSWLLGVERNILIPSVFHNEQMSHFWTTTWIMACTVHYVYQGEGYA